MNDTEKRAEIESLRNALALARADLSDMRFILAEVTAEKMKWQVVATILAGTWLVTFIAWIIAL